uniref:Uncharacterized protein n=1 Tax=Clytia hemisphaerica TaxID=252671 RepID=A0A7M5WHX5_9CNID
MGPPNFPGGDCIKQTTVSQPSSIPYISAITTSNSVVLPTKYITANTLYPCTKGRTNRLSRKERREHQLKEAQRAGCTRKKRNRGKPPDHSSTAMQKHGRSLKQCETKMKNNDDFKVAEAQKIKIGRRQKDITFQCPVCSLEVARLREHMEQNHKMKRQDCVHEETRQLRVRFCQESHDGVHRVLPCCECNTWLCDSVFKKHMKKVHHKGDSDILTILNDRAFVKSKLMDKFGNILDPSKRLVEKAVSETLSTTSNKVEDSILQTARKVSLSSSEVSVRKVVSSKSSNLSIKTEISTKSAAAPAIKTNYKDNGARSVRVPLRTKSDVGELTCTYRFFGVDNFVPKNIPTVPLSSAIVLQNNHSVRNTFIIPKTVSTVSQNKPSAPRNIPTVPQNTTLIPRNIPIVSQNTTVPKNIPTVSQNTTVLKNIPTVPQDTASIPRNILTASQNTPVPRYVPTVLQNKPVPRNIPTVPQNTTSQNTPVSRNVPTVPQDAAVPRIIPTVSQNTASIPRNIPTVPQNTPVPRNIPTVPQNTPVPRNVPIVPQNRPAPRNIQTVLQNTASIPRNIPTVPQNTPVPRNIQTAPQNTPVPRNIPTVPQSTPFSRNIPTVLQSTPFSRSIPTVLQSTLFSRSISTVPQSTPFSRSIPIVPQNTPTVPKIIPFITKSTTSPKLIESVPKNVISVLQKTPDPKDRNSSTKGRCSIIKTEASDDKLPNANSETSIQDNHQNVGLCDGKNSIKRKISITDGEILVKKPKKKPDIGSSSQASKEVQSESNVIFKVSALLSDP